MTMSANFHRITRVESKGRDGTHWLHIEDWRGNHIALHMEAHEAEALADAWAEAQREPEPLDAETVAGRKSAYERDLIDAGRGHLIGGAA